MGRHAIPKGLRPGDSLKPLPTKSNRTSSHRHKLSAQRVIPITRGAVRVIVKPSSPLWSGGNGNGVKVAIYKINSARAQAKFFKTDGTVLGAATTTAGTYASLGALVAADAYLGVHFELTGTSVAESLEVIDAGIAASDAVSLRGGFG